ncbi:hypothetical protein BC749_102873 [Flavobacterium araucananum]|nr:hypothetical protein BC749_102873 [Flavobacterium araucananum]
MFMEALALSNDKTDCMNLQPRWQNYEQSILGNLLQPDSNDSVVLQKGIHLHWSLPKALKHSFIDEKGESVFPYVPNRWMVVRIRTDQGITNMPSRTWIIKSDENNTLINNEIYPDWVVLKENKLTFKNLGKAFEYTNQYEDTITEPILTGVGAADPYFASFYPSSKNVFGFHDDLKDIDSDCTVTYIVNGWYSDPAQDPLTPLNFEGKAVTKEQINKSRDLDWFKQQWKYTDGEYPESCLLHSSVTSINWNLELKNGVPDGDVQVYAGNTAIESLSAQIIKSNNVKKSGVEELLNALQYQLLEDRDKEPGLESIKTEIHKRGFSPKNRDLFWEVTRVEASDKQLEDKQDNRPHFPENKALLKDLKELNEEQIAKNSIDQQILSLQQEYYFLWYKQANKTVHNDTVAGFDYEGSRTIILDKIVEAKVERDLCLTAINKHKNNLKLYKELSDTNGDYELKEKLEDRFWEPNDLVLLFCGSGVGNLNKPVFQTSNKEIKCRTENQILNRLDLEVPYNTTFIPVAILPSDFSVPKITKAVHDKIPFDTLKALIYETLLLDSSLALDIALMAYKRAYLGEGKDKKSDSIISFSKKVIQTQEKPNYTGDTRPYESFALTRWSQAWTPLFMTWKVAYTPHEQNIKDLDLLENTKRWKLEDGLYFKNQAAKATAQSIVIEGISPFSNSVAANLKRMVPDSITKKYGDLNLIAQSLSGLHKNLLMQRPEIQLPPFKYNSNKEGGFDSDFLLDVDELNKIGENGYQLGSNPGDVDGKDNNIFNPLRSGLLQIKSISIVDIFGQSKKVIIDNGEANPKVTCSVTLLGDEKVDPDTIPLPPRIIQPSRLQFNWLNSADEVIYQDAGILDNPVLGWLVPNYLDNSILVYDGEGNEVVVLQIVADLSQKNKLVKNPFPGRNAIPQLTDKPQLQRLLDTIDTGAIAAGIMDLAYKINLNITGGNALQNNTAALLCGQPIALVRCALKLETLGLPYYNQRWDLSGKEDTGNIETVKFPLSLGNYTLEKDGLLGYFTDAQTDSFYTTTNAPDFYLSKSEPFFKSNNSLKIALNQDPLKVTLLVDPSAGVHLSTAILPTKFVELFQHNSSRLLSGLNISFMVAPFIADKVDPGIPIPSGINADWKWTHKSDVTTWQSDAAVAEGKTKQISGFKKQQVYEGWLRLNNLKTNK